MVAAETIIVVVEAEVIVTMVVAGKVAVEVIVSSNSRSGCSSGSREL